MNHASNWQNWSGSIAPSQARLENPRDLDALAKLVRYATGPVRPVGSGHSWPHLIPNDHLILQLDHFNQVGKVDTDTRRAWIGAGARLHDVSPQLSEQGYAFRNLGDIDVQTLAGATSTGTHGTGQNLQALHAEITGLRLVTGTGEQMEISTRRNSDRLDGARVGLGALGVLTDIEVQLVERHKLHRRMWAEKHETLLARAEILWAENRNFEFFYIPFSGFSFGLTHNIVDAEDTPRTPDTSDGEVMQLKKYATGCAGCRLCGDFCCRAPLPGAGLLKMSWAKAGNFYPASAMCCSTKWNITCRLILGSMRWKKYATISSVIARTYFSRLKHAAPKPTQAGCRRFKAKTEFRLQCIATTKTHMSSYSPMLNRFSAKPVGARIGASSTN